MYNFNTLNVLVQTRSVGMKKLILSTIAAAMLSVPSLPVYAGSGDTAAGVAAGLVGGAMITGIASQSGRGARREAEEARREAERARLEAEAIRREREQERYSKIERRHIMSRSDRMTAVLLFAVLLLFLSVIALGVLVLRRR